MVRLHVASVQPLAECASSETLVVEGDSCVPDQWLVTHSGDGDSGAYSHIGAASQRPLEPLCGGLHLSDSSSRYLLPQEFASHQVEELAGLVGEEFENERSDRTPKDVVELLRLVPCDRAKIESREIYR